MNLRIPNDSAIDGILFNRRLNYAIPISQSRQDIFDIASFLAKLRSARRRRILIVFLHVSTDPARAAAPTRALQWSGNPYGNGYGVEMDGNGAQFLKMLWIGLDLGKVISLKR